MFCFMKCFGPCHLKKVKSLLKSRGNGQADGTMGHRSWLMLLPSNLWVWLTYLKTSSAWSWLRCSLGFSCSELSSFSAFAAFSSLIKIEIVVRMRCMKYKMKNGLLQIVCTTHLNQEVKLRHAMGAKERSLDGG